MRERWAGWIAGVDAQIGAGDREALHAVLGDLGRPRGGDARQATLLFDSEAAPRVLGLIGWILDGECGEAERDEAERALFVAAFLLYAGAWIEHAALDPAVRLPATVIAPAARLAATGAALLLEATPEAARATVREELRICEARRRAANVRAFDGDGERSAVAVVEAAIARWGAAAVIARAACARAARSETSGDQIVATVAAYTRAAQVEAELRLLANDAIAGRRSGAIAILLEESGGSLVGVGAGDAIVGAAALSSRLAAHVRNEHAAVAAHVGAVDGGLGQAVDDVARSLGEAAALFVLAFDAGPSVTVVDDGRFPDRADAIRRAREAALADPSLREAWEVHRWGLFNQPVLTARRFPMALVLEHLGHAGVDVGAQVDALLASYRRDGYRYFEEPCPMPPDIDTLGAMLRIARFAGDRVAAAEILATPLAWLRANMPSDGDVGVWLLEGPPRDGWDAFTTLIAGWCAGCQMHLALGLLAHADGLLASVVKPLLAPLVAAIAHKLERHGTATSAFYGPTYLMLLAAELGPQSTALRAFADRLIAVEAAREPSPQTAALLLLATPHDDTRRAGWTARLLEAQRWDGAFDDEPVYTVPRRAGVSAWYSSRTLTTAIALRALVSV